MLLTVLFVCKGNTLFNSLILFCSWSVTNSLVYEKTRHIEPLSETLCNRSLRLAEHSWKKITGNESLIKQSGYSRRWQAASPFPRKFQYFAIGVICDKVVSRGPPEKRKRERFRANREQWPTSWDLSMFIVYDNKWAAEAALDALAIYEGWALSSKF